MSELPPPGFYPDANGDERWWDGAQWTDRLKAAEGAADAATPEPLEDEGKTQVRPAASGEAAGGAAAGPAAGAAWQPSGQQQPQQQAQQGWQQESGQQWGQQAQGHQAGQQQWAQQPQGHQAQGQQWQAGPHGAGAPGPYGSSAQPKSKTPLIIGAILGVLLLVAGVIVAIVLLTGGDDNDDNKKGDDDNTSQTDDPSEDPTDGPTDGPTDESSAPVGDTGPAVTAVTGYLDAVTRQDCTAMKTFVTGPAATVLPDCASFTPNPGYSAEYEITGSRVAGDKVEVDTTESFTISGGAAQEGNCTYSVVQQSGKWLVESARCT